MTVVRRKTQQSTETKMDMTPMIDVVFLLLIFFMLTMEFKLPEGYLKSYLPRDRGSGGTPQEVKLAQHRIVLRWDDVQRTCLAFANRIRADAQYSRVQEEDPSYMGLTVKAIVPDWDELKADILKRQQDHGGGPDGKGLPIIIDFDSDVPVQFVERVYDACNLVADELGRALDVTFARPEMPID